MDLIAVLKAEFDEAVGDYEGAWEIYLAEFVYRWHSDGEINEPRSPACYDGGEWAGCVQQVRGRVVFR